MNKVELDLILGLLDDIGGDLEALSHCSTNEIGEHIDNAMGNYDILRKIITDKYKEVNG